MKNLNEDINRLRQIMSYDRSRSLLISESQYSIEDSIELEEQEETMDIEEQSTKLNPMVTDTDLMGETGFWANFKGLFNDDRGGVKGVVDALDGFVSMDNLNTVYNTLKALKGKVAKDETQDPPVMIPAIKRFAELYKADENGDDLISDVESVGTMTLPATAETLKKKIINLIKSGESEKVSYQNDSNLEDMPTVGTPGKGEEPSKGKEPGKESDIVEGCPSIEDIKSGKVLLKVDGKDSPFCKVVNNIQIKVITYLKQKGIEASLPKLAYGHYGPLTASLVSAYQNLAGLKSDGVVGPKTIQSLGF